MNHKRKRPQNRRAGCKLCKPWKVNGYRTERDEGEKISDHRRRETCGEDIHLFLLEEASRGWDNAEAGRLWSVAAIRQEVEDG